MKIAIMGFGTIGRGVYDVLKTNSKEIANRVGESVEVKYILDLRTFEGEEFENLVIDDYNIIANDSEIGLVVETMGGVDIAFKFVSAMLENSKHVVTSNKALVADKGAELIALAKSKNVNFMFEASVGGGIPIIRPLLNCFGGDVIVDILGIINGTTNFILTMMKDKGMGFEEALALAQEKGYAEADPTADVDGFDACRKISILTSIVEGRQVNFENVPTEGIRDIDSDDIKYAEEMGYAIKLIARSKRVGDTYDIRVSPLLIDKTSPLYSVSDVFNAVLVRGNMLGDSMFYGSGAGAHPTASAVVADITQCITSGGFIKLDWEPEPLKLAEASVKTSEVFVRTSDTKENVEAVFDEVEFVSIGLNERAFISPVMKENELEEALGKLTDAKVIRFM